MQSDKIRVKSNGDGLENAVREIEKVTHYAGLEPKQARYLQLIVEETVGMVRSITPNFEALLWVESEGKKFIVNLSSDTQLDIFQREDLLQKSTSKKNSLARGIMGKIRNVFEICATDLNTLDQIDVLKYGVIYGGTQDNIMNAASYTPIWSLNSYVEGISDTAQGDEDNDEIEEACSELEYSIINSISDEIQVGVSLNKVQLKIFKNFE